MTTWLSKTAKYHIEDIWGFASSFKNVFFYNYWPFYEQKSLKMSYEGVWEFVFES